MKKLALLLILLVLPVFVLSENETIEVEDNAETTAGILPDSPFYPVDVELDKLSYKFFSTKFKAIESIEIADERLSEIELSYINNKSLEDINKAKEDYDYYLEELEKILDEIPEGEADYEILAQIHSRVVEHREQLISLKEEITNEDIQFKLTVSEMSEEIMVLESNIKSHAEREYGTQNITEEQIEEALGEDSTFISPPSPDLGTEGPTITTTPGAGGGGASTGSTESTTDGTTTSTSTTTDDTDDSSDDATNDTLDDSSDDDSETNQTCTDDCNANDYPTCDDANLHQCEQGSDGCYDLSITACENGCSDGVCMSDDKWCIDEDDGDYYSSGDCTDSEGHDYDDRCRSSAVLRESYCRSNTCAKKDYTCPTSYICGDGACIEEDNEVEVWCEDTDDGWDLYTKGTCTDSTGAEITDSCNGDNSITEADCSYVQGGPRCGSAGAYGGCGAGYVCSDGACVEDSVNGTGGAVTVPTTSGLLDLLRGLFS